MAENRVSQVPIEISGTTTSGLALVSQVPIEVSGTTNDGAARVSQVVVELSGLIGLGVYQNTTYNDPDTFPAGGTVVKVPLGIPVVQTATYVDPDTFPAGGTINNVQEIIGTATIASTASVFLNGALTNPTAITGLATIGSTAAVNGGGRAEIGLYTITLPPNAILGLMDLAALQLSQVLDPVVTPVSIEGAFTYVPLSTALVYSPGVVGDGETLNGTVTIGSTASVLLGGSLAGLPLVGTATVGSVATVPTPGYVQLQAGVPLLGSFTVPSTALVYPAGAVTLQGYILGLATVASTAQVYPGGVISAGGLVLAYQPGAFTWSGHGVKSMPVRYRNQHDIELLNDRESMQALMKSVERSNSQSQVVSQGGLGDLSRKTFRDYCAPVNQVNCHKVNLRKNLFERGKLLTPADGGAADHTVLEFWVPTGYHCSLLAYYTVYTGTGFVQGSGDIAWRIRVGNAWARNAGNLLFALGDSAGTVTLGTAIELAGDDRVQFQVNVPNVSGLILVGASYILCGVQGWLYPAGSWPQHQGFDAGGRQGDRRE
jgi:hypothetical protein